MTIIDIGLRAAAALASPAGPRARLCVLFLHRVFAQADPLQPSVPDAALFDRQMALLAKVFRVLPLDEAVERLLAGTLPARSICLTFDDGYRDNLDVACPILLRHRISATFFIASGLLDGGRMFADTVVETIRRVPSGMLDLSWLGLGQVAVDDHGSRRALIDRLTAAVKYLPDSQRDQACARLAGVIDEPLPNDLMLRSEHVRRLAQCGMSIGGHTVSHPILARGAPEQARAEIADNRAVLAALTGAAPATFAYPNGKPGIDYGAEHIEMVRACGYRAAFSTAWGAGRVDSDPLQLPRISPGELQPGHLVARLLRVAAGGGAFDQVQSNGSALAASIAA